MRQIKFRVWDVDSERFTTNNADGEYIWEFDGDGNIQIVALTTIDLCPGGIGHVQEERWLPINCVIEQFTGLHDKNGTEIYEGDILKSKSWGASGRAKHPYHVVEWGRVGWVATGYNGQMKVSPSLDVKSDFEIIGNIHENPELIKTDYI